MGRGAGGGCGLAKSEMMQRSGKYPRLSPPSVTLAGDPLRFEGIWALSTGWSSEQAGVVRKPDGGVLGVVWCVWGVG